MEHSVQRHYTKGKTAMKGELVSFRRFHNSSFGPATLGQIYTVHISLLSKIE